MDAFPPMKSFFHDPLRGEAQSVPAFITFPSVKDKTWETAHPTKTCCQMLMMAEFGWFEKYQSAAARVHLLRSKDTNARVVPEEVMTEYEALKERWAARAVAILKMYFPKVSLQTHSLPSQFRSICLFILTGGRQNRVGRHQYSAHY